MLINQLNHSVKSLFTKKLLVKLRMRYFREFSFSKAK